MPRVILSVVLIVALLASGVSAAWMLIATRPDAPKKTNTAPPMLVRTVELTPRPVRDVVIGFGTAAADRDARVAAEVPARVIEISPALQEGAAVTAGTVLIRLDDREYVAQRDQARSQLAADEAALAKMETEEATVAELLRIAEVELAVAERERGRVEGLFRSGIAGQREFDLARVDAESRRRTVEDLRRQSSLLPETRKQLAAAVELSQARVALAELSVERCTIAAPFDGAVQRVDVELGERVAPGVELFSMVDPDLIEVTVEIPMSTASRVAKGAPCVLSVEADESQRWLGEVVRVAPSGSAMTRTLSVYVEVDNREQATPLKPGMFVRAEIEGRLFADALALPRTAIVNGHVFTFTEGVVRRVPVTIEHSVGDVSVIRGPAAGSAIITTNLDSLADGMRVRTEPATPSVPPAFAPTAGDERPQAAAQ